MTIKAVFRVRCDGPCKGWLTETGEVAAAYGSATVRVAGLWPGERTARRAALGNGWEVRITAPPTLLCPTCKLSPPVRLDIRIPKAAPCLGTHDTWSICKECA